MTNCLARPIATSFAPLIRTQFENEEAIQTPMVLNLPPENWSSVSRQRDLLCA